MAHLYMIDDLPMKNVEFSIATLNYQNVRVLLEPKKMNFMAMKTMAIWWENHGMMRIE